MTTGARSTLMTAFTVFAFAACGGDGDGGGTTGPPPDDGSSNGGDGGAQPAAVAVVSGDGQAGKTGEPLGQPLVVRVADADGAAVSGVTVSWSVTSGGGSLSATTTTTDAQGRASVTFTPGPDVGTASVEASVSGVAGVAGFTVDVTTLVIRMQNTAFVAPAGGDAVSVPLGTTIEWVNRDNVQHTATSTDVPAGGQPFDSGLLGNGARFTFTPQVEGTWTYFCEVHPTIMVDATITVTAAGSAGGTSSDGDGSPPPSPDDPYGG